MHHVLLMKRRRSTLVASSRGRLWKRAHPLDHDDYEILIADLVILESGVVLKHLRALERG